MTQEERIVIAERIATALECQANYQQRNLDLFDRIAMALDRANLIAECFLIDYQQSRGGTHDRE